MIYCVVWLVFVASRRSGGGLVAYAEANTTNGAPAIVSSESENVKKKVVVLGTGWAGTSFLKNLNNPTYDVQVISPRNYFAFTPFFFLISCNFIKKGKKNKRGNLPYREPQRQGEDYPY